MELLKKLTGTSGAPNQEYRIREIVRAACQGLPVEMEEDCNGNLLVHRPPVSGRKDALKIVLDAHMDEPSFIVTKIYPNGLLGMFDHGGPDENCVANENVRIGLNQVPGIIIKPDPASINHAEFRIDIGANSFDEAARYVKIGDTINFYTEPEELDNNYMISRAFDDRAGCYTMIRLLENEYDVDLYALFAVQEETGIRGAKCARYLEPDININLEATGTAAISGIPENLHNAIVGKGPVVFIQDFTFMLHDELRRYIAQCGYEDHIPFQFRGMCVGGSDAGTWYQSGNGTPTSVIALPHYNCHGPSAIASMEDVENMVALGDSVLRHLSVDGKQWTNKVKREGDSK